MGSESLKGNFLECCPENEGGERDALSCALKEKRNKSGVSARSKRRGLVFLKVKLSACGLYSRTTTDSPVQNILSGKEPAANGRGKRGTCCEV